MIVAPLNNQTNLNPFKVRRVLARSANIWFVARRKTIRPVQDHTSFCPLKNRSIWCHFKTIRPFPCSKTLRLAFPWTTLRIVGCSWQDEQPCNLLPFQNHMVFKPLKSNTTLGPLESHKFVNTFAISTYIFILTCTTSPYVVFYKHMRLYTWVSNPLQLSLLWLQAIPKGQHLHPY